MQRKQESLAEFRTRIAQRSRRSIQCGDRVIDTHDERFIGRVKAIKWDNDVIIEWPNGWTSDTPIGRIRRVQ